MDNRIKKLDNEFKKHTAWFKFWSKVAERTKGTEFCDYAQAKMRKHLLCEFEIVKEKTEIVFGKMQDLVS
jgi:hypothetical protein